LRPAVPLDGDQNCVVPALDEVASSGDVDHR
jgi:hypothetical protein